MRHNTLAVELDAKALSWLMAWHLSSYHNIFLTVFLYPAIHIGHYRYPCYQLPYTQSVLYFGKYWPISWLFWHAVFAGWRGPVYYVHRDWLCGVKWNTNKKKLQGLRGIYSINPELALYCTGVEFRENRFSWRFS